MIATGAHTYTEDTSRAKHVAMSFVVRRPVYCASTVCRTERVRARTALMWGTQKREKKKKTVKNYDRKPADGGRSLSHAVPTDMAFRLSRVRCIPHAADDNNTVPRSRV